MNRILLTLCCLALALTGPLVARGSQEELESRIGLPDPPRANGTIDIIFGQEPRLHDDAGFYNAVPADKTCNVACSPAQSRAYAVATPGTDMISLSFRINEVEVWGIYKAGAVDPGTPPTEDWFTVKVHIGGPGSSVRARSWTTSWASTSTCTRCDYRIPASCSSPGTGSSGSRSSTTRGLRWRQRDPADDSCRSEGSYGADSDETSRAQPATYCYQQASRFRTHDCAP